MAESSGPHGVRHAGNDERFGRRKDVQECEKLVDRILDVGVEQAKLSNLTGPAVKNTLVWGFRQWLSINHSLLPPGDGEPWCRGGLLCERDGLGAWMRLSEGGETRRVAFKVSYNGESQASHKHIHHKCAS